MQAGHPGPVSPQGPFRHLSPSLMQRSQSLTLTCHCLYHIYHFAWLLKISIILLINHWHEKLNHFYSIFLFLWEKNHQGTKSTNGKNCPRGVGLARRAGWGKRSVFCHMFFCTTLCFNFFFFFTICVNHFDKSNVFKLKKFKCHSFNLSYNRQKLRI